MQETGIYEWLIFFVREARAENLGETGVWLYNIFTTQSKQCRQESGGRINFKIIINYLLINYF